MIQIGRERGFEIVRVGLAAQLHLQAGGVQEMPFDRDAGLAVSIDGITSHWTAQKSHMQPDLVGATGDGMDLQ